MHGDLVSFATAGLGSSAPIESGYSEENAVAVKVLA